MPIYAYRCTACGHAQDVLQKLSDPVLSECPACLAATFVKQLTAAGFQLKGSGWYVTDFRDGNKPAAPKTDDKREDKSEGKTASEAPAPATAAGAAAAVPADAAAPASPAAAAAAPPSSGS